MRVAWQSEIDPYASAVLAKHWPDVPNHGDITQMNGAEVEPVDIITGGFPCQDLSVAGNRAGLAGARSGLYFEIVRLVREMRDATDGRCPKFVILENVPGLLSSQRGRDFAVVLRELRQLGALDIGWRVLDAQHFGVPQRRRRVFIVADFGGTRAGQILFEPEGGGGDSAPRREAREATPASSGSSSQSGRICSVEGCGRKKEKRGLCNTHYQRLRMHGDVRENDPIVMYSEPQRRFWAKVELQSSKQHGIAAPLTAGSNPNSNAAGRRREDDENLVAFTNRGNTSVGAPTLRSNAGGDLAPMIAAERLRSDSHGALPMVAHAVTGHAAKGGDPTTDNYVTHSLTSAGHDASEDGTGRGTPLVTNTTGYQGDRIIDESGTWSALSAQGGNNGGGAGALAHQHAAMAVRRLMPIETERLQGFPDNWTAYGDDGAEMSDSARYRMCGNAVAVPVVEWLLSRIVRLRDVS